MAPIGTWRSTIRKKGSASGGSVRRMSENVKRTPIRIMSARTRRRSLARISK